MTLTLVVVLFLVAAILFGIEFILGLIPISAGRVNLTALGLCLTTAALLLWHGGRP